MKLALLFLLLLPGIARCEIVYLDELDMQYMLQDWGTPQVDKSVLGNALQVNGVQYQRGIGTHSISRYLLSLDEKAISFSGWAGADDSNDFAGNMEFRILADKKVIWSSGVLHKGMPARAFRVSLKGVRKLVLLVMEAGDGIMYDHADWLDAKFETTGRIIPEPAVLEKVQAPKYILTPAPDPRPKINGARVIGVHPGNPVLFKIPVTGSRPLQIMADNLPPGLVLDSEKGIIQGVVERAGTYRVVLKAVNSLGSVTSMLRIEVGERICLTPPMGWNSWNCWGLKVDEHKIRQAADCMSRDLIDHGWTYINIDDGWEAAKRQPDGQLPGNRKFSDLKSLCDSIHAKGLKFGIYSSPGPQTCGGYEGSYGYEQTDADTWSRWGIDYLKYDYCYYSKIVPVPTEALIKKPYEVMRKALDNVKRDIVYCVGFGAPAVWCWGKEAGGNQWRTTRDITDEWHIVASIGFFQDVCAPAIEPGCYNDPDMLVVGKLGLGWGKEVHDSYLSADEQYAHISLWCLQSAPLIIGCDLSEMDDFTINLLTNDEVIAVDQDPLVRPVKKIITPEGQIWYKQLEDGSVAVGLFNVNPYEINWNEQGKQAEQPETERLMLRFSDLGLRGTFKIRDLWRQQDIGLFTDQFSTPVAYHGVRLIRLIPQ
jgi:alpha-galactosidase